MKQISDKAKKMIWAIDDVLERELIRVDAFYRPQEDHEYLDAVHRLANHIASLEAENRALRHALELLEGEAQDD